MFARIPESKTSLTWLAPICHILSWYFSMRQFHSMLNPCPSKPPTSVKVSRQSISLCQDLTLPANTERHHKTPHPKTARSCLSDLSALKNLFLHMSFADLDRGLRHILGLSSRQACETKQLYQQDLEFTCINQSPSSTYLIMPCKILPKYYKSFGIW